MAHGFKSYVLIRHHALLYVSAFKPEVQLHQLNLLVDGEHLLGLQIDQMLRKIKKDTDTSESIVRTCFLWLL